MVVENMKVLQVISSFRPASKVGGTQEVVYEISKHLADRGHDVTVYTTDTTTNGATVPRNRMVNLGNLKVYYFRNLSRILASKKIVTPYYSPIVARRDMEGFDIVHIHEHRTILAAVASRSAKRHGIPYIVQSHGSGLPMMKHTFLKRLFDRTLGRKLLEDASRAIALTRVEVEQYMSIGVARDKIVTLPNGIDISDYSELPPRGEFRRKRGIKANERLVLFLARINRIKRPDLLVDAFAILRQELGDVKLAIVGTDDGYLSELRKKIGDSGVGKDILLVGPLFGREKIEAFVDSDIYVLPSDYETFPLTVLEAWACGTPVIVTRNCGISDIVMSAGLVTEHNKEKLMLAMRSLLEDDRKRVDLGTKGMKLVKERFEWNTIVKEIVTVYEEAIASAKE